MEAKHFAECSSDIQDQVAATLFEEWRADLAKQAVQSPADFKDMILKNFATWNTAKAAFLIFFEELPQKAIGQHIPFLGTISFQYTIASAFSPCFANLYIHPARRKHGYGKILVGFAERYMKKKRMKRLYLWCHEHLVAYYEKQGYAVIEPAAELGKGAQFMGKTL